MVGGGWVGWGALLLIASITSAFGFHNSPASSRSVAHLSHKVGTILHLEPHKSEHICPLNFAGRKCSYLAGGGPPGGVFDEHMKTLNPQPLNPKTLNSKPSTPTPQNPEL